MFKSIEYKLIFFVLLLIVAVITGTYFFIEGQYVYCGLFVFFILIILRELYIQHKKFNQNILFLLNALDNGDYSFHFTENKLSKRERELNQMMNRIKEILVRARKEVIENEKFQSLIIESVATGIILLDDKNNVQASNTAANKLLGLPILTHLNQLSYVDESFPQLFKNLHVNDDVQIKIINEREETQISLKVSKITMKKGVMKVVTLNNIGNELEAKEMESWIRLIRVMTHEIMNSIAPITSLSETLLLSYKMSEPSSTINNSLRQNTIDAFDTICSTAKGLTSFVESYRKFTGIPKPQLKHFNLVTLLETILHLEAPKMQEKNIEYSIVYDNSNTTINADESQISQILVNLIKNAIEAITALQGGKVQINVSEKEDRIHLEISNNGEPIPQEVIPHIFIPFFTTKDSGTGIGLSVSRYIMRLHGGNLKYYTSSEGWTVFCMIF